MTIFIQDSIDHHLFQGTSALRKPGQLTLVDALRHWISSVKFYGTVYAHVLKFSVWVFLNFPTKDNRNNCHLLADTTMHILLHINQGSVE